jgi:response regulator RpfG family c-di-GMP phosphodiesterase
MPRILIVDDEPQIGKCLRRLLVREGFEVAVAEGPKQALAVVDDFRPDLVLSDYRMPGMNGALLLAEVKKRCPTAVRVILSGYADIEAVLSSVNIGEICRFLKKPWDDDELVAQLRSMLESRQILLTLYRELDRADEAEAVASHDGDHLRVRVRSRRPFGVEEATALLARFAGSLDANGSRLVGGLLERHAGRVTLVADVGGDQSLTLEVPVGPPVIDKES